jgi:GLPGLI family protein
MVLLIKNSFLFLCVRIKTQLQLKIKTMKIYLILGFSLLIFDFLNAQRDEAHLIYSLEYTADSLSEEMKPLFEMYEGSTMELYSASDRSKTIMNMGTVVKTTLISDIETGRSLQLTESLAGKTAMFIEKDTTERDTIKDYKIQLLNEEKMVLGYTCKKATLETDDGTMTFWYIPGVQIYMKGGTLSDGMLPGLPLIILTHENGMSIKMEATLYEPKIKIDKKKLFLMEIPIGFMEVSSEDY